MRGLGDVVLEVTESNSAKHYIYCSGRDLRAQFAEANGVAEIVREAYEMKLLPSNDFVQ